jgi:hypothetical protein
MMIVVLIAGVGILLAGLLAVAYGIPIKEFGFGNTLIVTGVVGVCTGAMMLVLWIVVRELKNAAAALGRGSRPEAGRGISPEPAERGAAEDGFLFGHEPAAVAADHAQSLAPSQGQSRPRQGEPVSRDRPPQDPAAGPEAAAPAAQPRRNLLFSSTSRRERERAAARGAEPSMGGLHPAGPKAESAEALPSIFERARTDAPRRGGRAPQTDAKAGAARGDRHPPAEPPEDQPPPVTILKSGVVDGMAYSLYSDGSIEAQMPEGMMRFASIDELRAHLDQRP